MNYQGFPIRWFGTHTVIVIDPDAEAILASAHTPREAKRKIDTHLLLQELYPPENPQDIPRL